MNARPPLWTWARKGELLETTVARRSLWTHGPYALFQAGSPTWATFLPWAPADQAAGTDRPHPCSPVRPPFWMHQGPAPPIASPVAQVAVVLKLTRAARQGPVSRAQNGQLMHLDTVPSLMLPECFIGPGPPKRVHNAPCGLHPLSAREVCCDVAVYAVLLVPYAH